MAAPNSSTRKVLGRLSLPERNFVAEALRTETVGGVLLLIAAITALIWANTPIKESYESVRDFHLGPASLGLDLSIQHWAADGLLAVFFFVAGIELKRELVAGDLRELLRRGLDVDRRVGAEDDLLVEHQHEDAGDDPRLRMRADHLQRWPDRLRIVQVHPRYEGIGILQ